MILQGGIVSAGNYTTAKVSDVIVNGNIKANVGVNTTRSAGLAYQSFNLYGIMEGVSIAGKTLAYTTYITSSRYKTAYLSNVSHKDVSNGAILLDVSLYNNLTAYADYITINANEKGYYFGYNSDQTDIIVKRD